MPIPQVEEALPILRMNRKRFLYGLQQVPEDRLNWSPGGAAKTPLQLADKTAGFMSSVAHMLVNHAWPDRDRPAPEPSASREEALARLEAAFDTVRTAVEGLTEEDLQVDIPAPWGTSKLSLFVQMVTHVVTYHQGQLNYCQMAYGDEDPNIPPDWGAEF